ncbi:beta-hydroxyacyl-ACP dehydratase [Accumulibacter sp.]|uniref:ApeP family dehydratase n=1 Tax=Accumulibacter sp. TaxID=2053492 RepID=UPI0025F3DB1B|nr:beta-hydroxyacyl-ACP dehydratase [Accumulibacter sp.]MCM8614104.1 beta-hydroxyacyl-ACP dehydratase [Accumulibacter sp.]MCM8637872.1 beta-hydroxyacyl-ACP dehydratase [Accumulibacter sp.]MCM8641279.1 beta-hydroxyacyl-ACP dehydratase [Accumulibacter sp.]
MPIEDLLPHRGSMLLLTGMLEADAESATCEAMPDAKAWYAESDGTMPAWIGIELMAQTIAVHVALIARRAGRRPRPGVLLGTRAYRAGADRFPVGQPLQITARSTHRDATGLGAYDCTLADDRGTVLAMAAITVYEPEDFAQFLAGQGHGEAQ